jgi:hypothetical protein
MNRPTKPILWNRDFFAWLNLEVAIANVIIFLISNHYFLRGLNMFVAGVCFATWLLDSPLNDLHKLLRRSLNLNKEQVIAAKEYDKQKK